MKPTIDIHIDELLLDGVRSFDEKRIVLALERELARVLADKDPLLFEGPAVALVAAAIDESLKARLLG